MSKNLQELPSDLRQVRYRSGVLFQAPVFFLRCVHLRLKSGILRRQSCVLRAKLFKLSRIASGRRILFEQIGKTMSPPLGSASPVLARWSPGGGREPGKAVAPTTPWFVGNSLSASV